MIRNGLRSPYLVAMLLGLGCGGRVDESSGEGRGLVGGEGFDSGTDTLPASDAVAPVGSLDCLIDPTDRPKPSDFESFSWSREHVGCDGSSRCAVFVKLEASCSLWVQANNIPRTITMGSADCLAFERWLTSDQIAAGLRNLERCEGKPWTGNPESTEVTRTSTGSMGGKYERTCTVEPFGENRTCIQKVLDIYAPDVRILP